MMVTGASSDRMMVVLNVLPDRATAVGVSLDQVTVVCVTFDGMTVMSALFDRMTSFLSVLACVRSDAAELREQGPVGADCEVT